MQYDESTIADNNALLMTLFLWKQYEKKMLFEINLITDTRGLSIFKTVKSYFTKKYYFQ